MEEPTAAATTAPPTAAPSPDPTIIMDRGLDDPEELSPILVTHRLDMSALDPSFSLTTSLASQGLHLPFATEDTNPELASRLERIDAKHRSPFAWPASRKVAVSTGAFIAALLAAYSAGSYAMAAAPLETKWGVSSMAYNAGISVFVTGFGFAPMVLAPVSEAYGRYWVFVGAGSVSFLGTLGCALTDTFPGMLVARFVTGSGASVFATLVGGVVSDLYHKEERNTPMALYSLIIMVGTGVGPLISGVVVDRLGWRWIFWLQAIAVGLTTLVIFFFFAETRSNVVLEKKCRALTALYADTLLATQSDKEKELEGGDGVAGLSAVRVEFRPTTEGQKLSVPVLARSFMFPFKLLGTESVVFWFSVWVSFAWAILYLQFSSISITFRDVYGFSSTQVGLVYIAVIVGSMLITVVSLSQGRVLRKYWPSVMATPEGRLIPAGFQGILLPIGLFWFGWTSRPDISWASPAIAIGCCTMGIFSIYLAVFNYLADTYHRYASSALAAQSMCRNLVAGVLTLFVGKMLAVLGYGPSGSLLGGIGLLLSAIPWLLIIFGRKIRARSPFASELLDHA